MTEVATPQSPAPAQADGRYRILLPLDDAGRRAGLLRLAGALAQAVKGEVIALHIVTSDEEETDHARLQQTLDEEVDEGVSCHLLIRHAPNLARGILDVAREQDFDLILLNQRSTTGLLRRRMRDVLDPALVDEVCDVALLTGRLPQDADSRPWRILLATSGGPHTASAARLAVALARRGGGRVTLLTVLAADASEDDVSTATHMHGELLEEIQVEEGEARQLIERQVEREERIVPTISEVATEHDLLFIGASGNALVNRLLRGSVAEQVVLASGKPAVIFSHSPGVASMWMLRLWHFIDSLLPDLSDDERLDTYKRVRRGARGTTDFYALMLLSAIIATMGLLLNSGAVIIGAMLVAPLMMPILALGMSVVLGDLGLLRVAAGSTTRGVALVIGMAALLARLAPLALFTPEIEARTQPNLLDLSVALASGAAGAYAVARHNVAAALPGVAIAVALVPPLGAIGISLATGRWEAARGAALLFGTNLIAVTLAAALVYLLFGFFPHEEEQERKVLRRRGFLVVLALLFLIALPLASQLQQEVRAATLDRTLQESLVSALDEEEGIFLDRLDWTAPEDAPISAQVTLRTTRDVTGEMLNRIGQALTDAAGQDVTVQVVTLPALDPAALAIATPPPIEALPSLRAPEEVALEAAGGERLDGSVTVLASWNSAEQDSFLAVVKPFQDATGVTVLLDETVDLDASLARRIDENNLPTIAALPGPGAMAYYAREGHLVDLDEALGRDVLETYYSSGWIELGSVEGLVRGIYLRAAAKGLIWYNPRAWQQRGYEIPGTWDEMMELSSRMSEEGTTPWCIGLADGAASGWPGTDWIENILLRQTGAEVYDWWRDGEILWITPAVRRAWESWGEIVAQPRAMVFGGRALMRAMSFEEAVAPLFTERPGCFMYHQASFMPPFILEIDRNLVPGEDFDFFLFPPFDPTMPDPLVVAGDLLGMFEDTPQARALIRYLLTPEAQAIWVARGGAVSPNRQLPMEAYPDPVSHRAAQLLTNAATVRFDASDMMPPLMRDAFLQAILDYISAPDELDEILNELDDVRQAAYP